MKIKSALKRRIISLLLCLAMIVTILPEIAPVKDFVAHAARCNDCGEQDPSEICRNCWHCDSCAEICAGCQEKCSNCDEVYEIAGKYWCEDCFDEAETVDERFCDNCKEEKDIVCKNCGRCDDCEDVCVMCEENCSGCASDDIIELNGRYFCEDCFEKTIREEYSFEQCGNCGALMVPDGSDFEPEELNQKLNDTFKWQSQECENHCLECIEDDNLCDQCNGCALCNPRCETCGLCSECDIKCSECDTCKEEPSIDYCEDCEMCVDCAKDNEKHCYDCGECFQDVDRFLDWNICVPCAVEQEYACPSCGDSYEDGDHCISCGACGIYDAALCLTCDRCEECALDEGIHCVEGCGKCFMDVPEDECPYEKGHCVDECEGYRCGTCERCFNDRRNDFCTEHEVCNECAYKVYAYHCGYCYTCPVDVEFCETCRESGEIACVNCCRELSYGYGCEEGYCIYSEDFKNYIFRDISYEYDGTTLIILADCKFPEETVGYPYPWVEYVSKGGVITEIIIEDGVTEIPDNCFEYMRDVVSCEIPDSVKSIGNQAFLSNHALTSIDLPSSVSSIGEYAFENCDKLRRVSMAYNLNYIGKYAFWRCDSLEFISIPASVNYIGERAFGVYTKEPISRKITFKGDKPNFDGSLIFENNNAKVYFPYKNFSYNSVLTKNFGGSLKWLSYKDDSEIGADKDTKCGDKVYWSFDEEEGKLVISGTGRMYDYDVKNFSSDVTPWASFSEEILYIEIEEGITYIGDCAFAECVNLREIKIPWSVKALGKELLYLQEGLNHRYYSLVYYGSEYELKKMIEATGFSFDKYENDENYIGQNMEFVWYADMVCQSFGGQIGADIRWILNREDEKLIVYGSGALDCDDLSEEYDYTYRTYPNFYNTIIIEEGITGISGSAFISSKSNGKDLYIADSVEYLGEDAFYLSNVGNVYFGLNSKLKEIGRYAFSGTYITSIELPAGVTLIDDCAFYEAESLEEITIPVEVKTIGDSAFSDTNLKTVYYEGNKTQWQTLISDENCGINNEKLKNANVVYVETTIKLSDTSITLPTLEKTNIIASVRPVRKLTWSSSNEKVATVDQNGVVTAKTYGKATITVTAEDGTTADCEVQTLFCDVAGSNVKGEPNYQYYYDPVYWAADKGITTGYTSGEYSGKFGVGLDCTREDFALFLYRLAGEPKKYSNGKTIKATDADSVFPDVAKMSNTSAKKKAIVWAYGEGIIKGYTSGEYAGKFGVGVSIDRRSAMIMIWRYAGKPSAEKLSGTKAFTDVVGVYKESTDSYKAIAWAAANGITGGLSKAQAKEAGLTTPCFGCDVTCFREQMITFLYRYNNLK